ncbi:MAG: HlyD family efflux transporter periplasmic adaptor subunit [Pseudolabrys sp.]|nr:HlyD family efflux transporter periplasmic adaptor subunit [Pseudolabrys sp.]
MNVPAGGSDRTSDRVGAYYDTLLDSLADGVLSIAPDHRIEVLNATGAALLGLTSKSVVGQTLVDVFLGDEVNDAFMDAIIAATSSGKTETVKTVVNYNAGDQVKRLAVASTAYRVPLGAQSGKLGVVVTFNDVTEMLRLRTEGESLSEALASEHAALQAAYLRLEDAATRERSASRRIGLIRNGAVAAVIMIFAAAAYYNWDSVVPAGFSSGSEEPKAEIITVTTQPITSRVVVVGSVDAGSMVSVVGPFDGPVKQKFFDYGGPVERDKPLLAIDTAETQIKLREAEGARIKARQRVDELNNWDNGVDVSRARRTLGAAEMERSNLAIRIAQTQMLLNKGIVPKDEHTQLLQQQYTQNMQIESAKQDLAQTLERGSEENRRLAEFELLNAQAKVDELQRDLAGATVIAPVSGVVLMPSEGEGKRPDLIAVGSRVSRGATVFTIGDLETLSIRVKVDEIDINKVRIGQQALVTGDAFDGMTMTGNVTAVAAQAAGDAASRSGMPTFPVTVQISNLTREQRARVHVGMSATVAIVSYDNPNAVVIPQSAVRDEDGKRFVLVRRESGVEPVPVTLGISTPDGIEITQGLQAGDNIQAGE